MSNADDRNQKPENAIDPNARRRLRHDWNARLFREGFGVDRGILPSSMRGDLETEPADVVPDGTCAAVELPPVAMTGRSGRLRSLAELVAILMPSVTNKRVARHRLLRWLRAADKACDGKILTRFGEGRNSRFYTSIALIRRYAPALAPQDDSLSKEVEELRERVRTLEVRQARMAKRIRELREQMPKTGPTVHQDAPGCTPAVP